MLNRSGWARERERSSLGLCLTGPASQTCAKRLRKFQSLKLHQSVTINPLCCLLISCVLLCLFVYASLTATTGKIVGIAFVLFTNE